MNKFFTIFFLVAATLSARAQSALFIDTSFTAEQMVLDFFSNSCVTPSNITFTGAPLAIGYFEAANTNMGVNAGIVLSTGDVYNLANEVGYFSTTAHLTSTDLTLDSLNPGAPGFDAAVLEFDILVDESDTLSFNYVFGSEEYPEYVNSPFNDIFGFFIYNPEAYNISMVPNTSLPVAINNVNDGLNAAYYIDNETAANPDIALDGMTTPLPAIFEATAGASYHVKIAVMDVADQIFDSGVFLATNSLCGSNLVDPPAIFALTVVDDQTVAINNQSRYATSWNWNFGDGTTSTERNPGEHVYTNPGAYSVTLITQNFCCSDTLTLEVQVGAVATDEAQQDLFRVFPTLADESVTIDLGAPAAFEYMLSDAFGKIALTGKASQTISLPVANLEAGVYFLTVVSPEGRATKRIVVR